MGSYWYILAVVAAAVFYFVLQQVDDQRNRKQGKPLAGTGQRVMLGFIVLLVCLGISYMLAGMASGSSSGARDGGTTLDGREAWYNHIQEDIHVGLPGF